MKARTPYFRTAKEKRMIRDEVKAEWRKVEAEELRKMAERCLKINLFVLNRDFHFGKKRANDFYKACGELLAGSGEDEVFWEHIDRVVIDQLEITEFQRDYTEKGKAVRI